MLSKPTDKTFVVSCVNSFFLSFWRVLCTVLQPNFCYLLCRQTNLGELQTCSKYIVSDGVRQGCHFHESRQPWNASRIVYILVNGSQDYAEVRPFHSAVDPQTIGIYVVLVFLVVVWWNCCTPVFMLFTWLFLQ